MTLYCKPSNNKLALVIPEKIQLSFSGLNAFMEDSREIVENGENKTTYWLNQGNYDKVNPSLQKHT